MNIKSIMGRVLLGNCRYGQDFSNFFRGASFGQRNNIIKYNRLLQDTYSGYPLSVKIEINGQCNLRCVMCKRTSLLNRDAMMTTEQFIRVLDELGHITMWAPHGYNEPMLHPKFFEFAKIANERDIALSLVTNGTLLHRKNADILASLKPYHIRVSVDAVAEEYERIRTPAKWHIVEANIRYMATAFKKSNTKFSLYATIWKDNVSQIYPLISFARELDVPIKFADITWMNEYGKSNKDNSIREDAQYSYVARKSIDHIGYKKASHALTNTDKRYCTLPWSTPYIDVVGDIYPCTDNMKPNQKMGNIFNESFSDIWNNDKYSTFREDSINGVLNSCKNCIAWGSEC